MSNLIFKNKVIMITGGCGSIGKEIIKQLIAFEPKEIRVFDNWETGFFNLGLDTSIKANILTNIIGDVRNKEEINSSLKGVDVVFHAAALKHVPFCELNPFAAINTNVIGTQNVLEGCINNNINHLLYISTDKAINPINTMGATKLLGERLITNTNIQNKNHRFSAVRFGNVLNSVGSVIPIFREQIKRGGPLTITSKAMTRFFMSMKDAVSLVIKACTITKGGEIFILKMKSVKIFDLAEVLIEELSPIYGYKPSDIIINLIGVRAGEKLHESLISNEELPLCVEKKKLLVINNKQKTTLQKIKPDIIFKENSQENKISTYSSNNAQFLDKKEIKKLLYKQNILNYENFTNK